MKVRDIMTVEVETAAPDTTLEEIATMMKQQDVGSIPVVDGDELAGIITDRDIVVRCIAAGDDPSEVSAEQVLSGQLHAVEPDSDVEAAARIMAQHQIRRLPVVEGGLLVGMVSIGDIAVKEGEDTAGDALEDISQGVRKSGRGSTPAPGRKQPESAGRKATVQGRGERKAQSTGKKRADPKRAGSGPSGRRRRAS